MYHRHPNTSGDKIREKHWGKDVPKFSPTTL